MLSHAISCYIIISHAIAVLANRSVALAPRSAAAAVALSTAQLLNFRWAAAAAEANRGKKLLSRFCAH
eukprot:SAG31_NODE_18877_length_619_cov_1.286538_2_plen_67_part_01